MPMPSLRLAALDAEDLGIISAHVQDAVTKVADIDWRPAERRLIVAMNRFVWEAAGGRLRQHNERRRAVLSFDRVLAVRSAGIRRDHPDDVLSLLAVSFTATDEPAGHVELVFAGGATMRIEVECVEARLADLGGAWEASSRPRHGS